MLSRSMALPSRNHRETHEVYIWFVLDGDGLYVGAANLNRQWVRNVQKTPKIRLSIAAATAQGRSASQLGAICKGMVTPSPTSEP
jgi:hypothetical protein